MSMIPVLVFVGLVIAQEIFHRRPRFALAVFIVAPIIFYTCWLLLVQSGDWFAWGKVLSIASGAILLSIFRTTKLGRVTKVVQWVTYVFLVVNIFEAVVKDIVAGNSANYMNALAGLLLILTLERIYIIYIDRKGSYKDLYWGGMTLSWIIGYTVWNWVFVYLNFGLQSSMIHLAVLSSALVVVFTDKQRWLQARVFTLGMFFILFHSVPHLDAQLTISGDSGQVGFLIALISSGFMVVYATLFIRRSFRGGRQLLT